MSNEPVCVGWQVERWDPDSPDTHPWWYHTLTHEQAARETARSEYHTGRVRPVYAYEVVP